MTDELKPCPFCRDSMIAEHGMFGHHSSNQSCLLRHEAWPIEMTAAWNTRQQSILSESVNEEARDAAIMVCRITGWDGVAKRLEQGWTPEPGTREGDLLALLSKHPVNLDGEAVERVEAISRAIDPGAWRDELPGMTRDAVEGFHMRRQLANAAARRVLAALTTTGVNNG